MTELNQLLKQITLIFGKMSLYGSMCAQSLSDVSDSLWPHELYVARQAPLCIGFSRQEHWSGLPFPSRDLPDPGIEPRVSCASCFGRWVLYTSTTWEALMKAYIVVTCLVLLGVNRIISRSYRK